MDSKPSSTAPDWRETAWRRALTEAERRAAELKASQGSGTAAPGAPRPCSANADLPMDLSAEFERELRLTQALRRLPDVPVASNFTARVLAAADGADGVAARPDRAWAGHWSWDWRAVWPRVAATAAIVIFTGTIWQRHEVHSERRVLAMDVAQVASYKPVPSVDALCNFDAIQRMSQPVAADKELLALMQ